jgi:hypothetical protein
MTVITEVLTDASTRARQQVTVSWRAPLTGFAIGFVASFLPALFVGEIVFRTQLPLVAPSLSVGGGVLVACFMACFAGIAGAVCAVARDSARR